MKMNKQRCDSQITKLDHELYVIKSFMRTGQRLRELYIVMYIVHVPQSGRSSLQIRINDNGFKSFL